jgi:hypothetical protein
MCLDFKNQVVIIIEFDYPGIIDKYGNTEIFFAFNFPDLRRGIFYICFEKRINLKFFPGIIVFDSRVKYFMFAVFLPGLRQTFQFDIRDIVGKTEFFPRYNNILLTKIMLHGLHLFEIQSKQSFQADFH